jgi:hypothetical protein
MWRDNGRQRTTNRREPRENEYRPKPPTLKTTAEYRGRGQKKQPTRLKRMIELANENAGFG